MKQSVRAQVIERRTYLRPLDKNGTVFETVEQAWDRVIGHQRWLWERAQGSALNAEQEAELEELRQLFLQRKVTVSGRTRWLGGTDIAKERQASQFNCSFGVVQTVHDVVDTIWLLLQGCGVGFSANVGVLNGFVAPIAELEIIRSTKTLPIDMNGNPVSDPSLKGDPKNRETFDKTTGVWTIRVGDSAEAWAKFFGKLLAFKQHAKKLVVDFSEIRPAGYRLSGYGWISSGDNQITKAVEGIFEVMNRSAGKLLTAIDILDIENHLGTILSSRRSAEIALYPFDGTEIDAFISAKKDNYGYFVRSTKATIRSEPNDAAEVVKVVNQGTALYANMEKRKDVIKNGYVQVVDETWTPMGWVSLTEAKKDRVHRQMSNNSILFHQKPTRRQLKNVFKQIAAAGGSEPGFINANAAQRRAPYFKGVNPCVTAETWVETDHGPRRVADLIDVPFIATVNGSHYPTTGFWKTGEKQVYRVKTNRGYELRATGNHKVYVETKRKQKKTGGYDIKNEWIEIQNLKAGDRIVLDDRSWMNFEYNQDQFDAGWLLGEMVGDGGFNPEKYPGHLRFWGEHAEQMANAAFEMTKRLFKTSNHHKGACFNATHGTWSISTKALDDLANELIDAGTKNHTDALEMQPLSFLAGFVRGMFDADGSVQGTSDKGVSIRLDQSNRDRLLFIQRVLLRLGVASSIYDNRRCGKTTNTLPNGKGGKQEYDVKPLFSLCVSKDNIQRFDEVIGFADPSKSAKLKTIIANRKRIYRERFTANVAEIIEDGIEAVYDVTVKGAHRFVANGTIVHNCAEILLGDKSFCNLVETAVCRFNGDEPGLHRAHRIIARANYRQTCVDLRDGILQHTWHELNDFLHLCGVGVTGVVGWEFVDDAEAWEELRAVAVEGANSMADELGLPRPQMVTTVKPSGTQTKVFGCEGDEIGEGVHKPLGRYIFNNVNFSKDDPLIKVLEKANYRITVNPSDDTGRIVTLPVEFQNVAFDKVTRKMKRTKMVEVEEGYQPIDGELMLMPNKVLRKVEEDVEIEVNLESAITQLERYKMLQNHYVDHNCFTASTQFYTKEKGMAAFGDFNDGETVNVMNRFGKWTPATVKSFGNQEIWRITVDRAGTKHVIETTANHRWPVSSASDRFRNKEKWVTTKELAHHKKNLITVLPDLQIDMDSEYVLRGIVYGDGTIYNTHAPTAKAKVTLCGNDGHMKTDLLPLFEKAGYTGSPKTAEGYQTVHGLPVEWKKYLPIIETSTPEQLRGFIAGWFATDGSVSGGVATIGSKNKSDMEWLQKAAPKAGISVMTEIKTVNRKGFNDEKTPFYNLILAKKSLSDDFFVLSWKKLSGRFQSKQWKIVSVEKTERVEPVYCVVEPISHEFVLEGGILTGNCSITVSYDIDEVPEIIDWLLDNWDSYIGVSFLYRNDPTKTAADLGYAYLPQEVVDAKTYHDYVATLLPVDLNGTDSEEMVQIEECTSGGCPIR